MLEDTRSTFECMVILKFRWQGPKRRRTTGQICPILSTRLWTLSPGLENNHGFKCWSSIFPTILIYMNMLGNCQNNNTVYGYSPIQGTKFYSCWNFMTPGSQSGTYAILNTQWVKAFFCLEPFLVSFNIACNTNIFSQIFLLLRQPTLLSVRFESILGYSS